MICDGGDVSQSLSFLRYSTARGRRLFERTLFAFNPASVYSKTSHVRDLEVTRRPGRPGNNANLRSSFPRSHLRIRVVVPARTGLEDWPAEEAASCQIPSPLGLRRFLDSP